MELTTDLRRAICSLFEVHQDEAGVQRIVTPMQYSGSGDHIVVRVRPRDEHFEVDENGEACLYASMADGDVDSEAVKRWVEELSESGAVQMRDDEVLGAKAVDERLIPILIFRVAEAAQQLYALATSRPPRKVSEFKAAVARSVSDAVAGTGYEHAVDVPLPIAGNFVADHVVEAPVPLIVIVATGIQRLLEAELIHMRYQVEKRSAFVVAAVESQKAVGPKQFERANYYTDKTVTFSRADFSSLIRGRLSG
ncbi:hypothetical protein FOZ76_15270 [Verticiella sediminum]|uniref:DUF1828 domain-containing protein n=1 Tax=Verticiella sediminum TaxID=1247510 RepID=A0A556AIR8_9BURK|nr:hypothetical protein [Verticiella sediminum]TSH92766.1 hypothetical protein FOZ76_15270 [Verticiella sediminum]